MENKDIGGLYKLSESYNNQEVYKEICNIEVYKEICNILVENKDIGGLYKLERSASRESLPDLSKKIDYKIRELKNNK